MCSRSRALPARRVDGYAQLKRMEAAAGGTPAGRPYVLCWTLFQAGDGRFSRPAASRPILEQWPVRPATRSRFDHAGEDEAGKRSKWVAGRRRRRDSLLSVRAVPARLHHERVDASNPGLSGALNIDNAST